MRQFAAILTAALFMSLFSSQSARSGESPSPDTVEFTGEIVIGATFPLSGEFENYGQSAYYGANTRVKMINAAGGVNGKRLVLEWRDNRSDTNQAALDVRELVQHHNVPAILGPLHSDALMAVGDIARELETVVVSPLARIEAGTLDNPWVFRIGFSNTRIASGLIAFQMRSFGVKRCGILYDSRHASCSELSRMFEEIFTERGGVVVDNRSIVDADGNKDYATPLNALVRQNPDIIFAATYANEATELIRTAKTGGVTTRFCAPDTWDNELVYKAAGSRLVGTAVASSLFETAFNYRPFQRFYTAMEQAGMDMPDAQAACAYDAVSLIAIALAKGESSPEIRDGLLAVNRQPLATGRITMSPNGTAQKPLIIRIVEIREGQLVPVFAERLDE